MEKKYYIVFDDQNNIISQPSEYTEGNAIVSAYNVLYGTREAITGMFPDATFPEDFI